MANKYIFLNLNSDTLLFPDVGIMKDLKQTEEYDIQFVKVYRVFNNFILNFLRKFLLSTKVNEIIDMPFKDLFYELKDIEFDDNSEYFIIIPTVSLTKIDISFLKKIKMKYRNIRLIVLLIDSLKAHSLHLVHVRDKLFSGIWDLVLTFDKKDALEYGFQYFGYTYYSALGEIAPSDKESDLYYIGVYKGGRESLVGNVYDYLTEHNTNCDFKVVSSEFNNVAVSKLKTIKNKLTYPEVIADVKSTNCVLEILQNGQKTQSIRYFEAIVYNKKLLSNNPNISTLPFYDSRYMKYFEKAEDIDWEWVKKREDIDYRYDNEFSPVHMLEFIEKYFETKR